MRKAIKIISITLACLISVIFVALFIAVKNINPAMLKPIIIADVKKYSGYELTIDGDIKWTWYPVLSLKIEKIKVNNSHRVHIANIESALVAVKIKKIFAKEIVVKHIHFNNITLTQFPTYLFKQLHLKSDDMQMQHPFAMNGNVELQNLHSQLKMTLQFEGMAAFHDVLAKILLHNFKLSTYAIYNHENIDAHATGNVEIDLHDDFLVWQPLLARVTNLDINGFIKLSQIFTYPTLDGLVQIRSPNLILFSQKMKLQKLPVSPTQPINASINFTVTKNRMTGEADLTIKQLTMNNRSIF